MRINTAWVVWADAAYLQLCKQPFIKTTIVMPAETKATLLPKA